MPKIPFAINERGMFRHGGKHKIYSTQNNLFLRAIELKKDLLIGQIVKRIRFYSQTKDGGDCQEQLGAKKMAQALVRRIIEQECLDDVVYVPQFRFLFDTQGKSIMLRQGTKGKEAPQERGLKEVFVQIWEMLEQ